MYGWMDGNMFNRYSKRRSRSTNIPGSGQWQNPEYSSFSTLYEELDKPQYMVVAIGTSSTNFTLVSNVLSTEFKVRYNPHGHARSDDMFLGVTNSIDSF